MVFQVECICNAYWSNIVYHTQANKRRSQLVASPLRNHAKKQFLYDDLSLKNIIFELWEHPLLAEVQYFQNTLGISIF